MKHPYDKGDRIIYKDRQLIVENVQLLYTTFHSLDNDTLTQIPHSQLTKDTIENLSRTLAEDRQNSRSSKEQVEVIVNPCHSSSDEDMLELTNCLQTYVKLEGLAGDDSPQDRAQDKANKIGDFNTANNAPISRYLCDKGLMVKLVWVPDKDKTQRSLRIEFRYQERVSIQALSKLIIQY